MEHQHGEPSQARESYANWQIQTVSNPRYTFLMCSYPGRMEGIWGGGLEERTPDGHLGISQ